MSNSNSRNRREVSIDDLDPDQGLQSETNKEVFLSATKGPDFQRLCIRLCEQSYLKRLIDATRKSAKTQVRTDQKDEYKLRRHSTVAPAKPESRLERAMWLYWGVRAGNTPEPFLRDICPHLVSYQVPLYNTNRKKERAGWGKIDLLGAAQDLTPVVIELKAGGSSEPLLRMVLEAAAYGIALQEAWESRFSQEWKKALEKLKIGGTERLPKTLDRCLLICAAPKHYWESGAPGCRDDYSEKAWSSFTTVLNLLESEEGLKVHFAKVDFGAELKPIV